MPLKIVRENPRGQCSNSSISEWHYWWFLIDWLLDTVNPIQYMHMVLWFDVLWRCYQLLWDWCGLFTHIFQGCFTGTGTIIWLPQCQWSNHEGYDCPSVRDHEEYDCPRVSSMIMRFDCSSVSEVIMKYMIAPMLEIIKGMISSVSVKWSWGMTVPVSVK